MVHYKVVDVAENNLQKSQTTARRIINFIIYTSQILRSPKP
jgi:hypothetical protein